MAESVDTMRAYARSTAAEMAEEHGAELQPGVTTIEDDREYHD